MLMIFIVGCSKNEESSTTNENFGLEYYKGAIPNSFYTYNFMDERALQVSGKPFMVVKYDKLTHNILDFEFGMSEVVQTKVPGVSIAAPPEPTIDGSKLDYAAKFGLKNPVVLLVNWPSTAWGGVVTNGILSVGGPAFFYYSGNGSKWSFSYLPAGSMTGGVEIINSVTGYETLAANSFNLLKF